MSDRIELTEEQFAVIKMFCMHKSMVVVCLHPTDEDDPAQKEAFIRSLETMKALESNGFVKNINDQCTDALDYAKKTGARTFDLFLVTEEAYNMFSAPEGTIN